MVLTQFKCQMCNHRFQAEVLDREDPRERHEPGAPLRCPNCRSTMVEILRVIQKLLRRVS